MKRLESWWDSVLLALYPLPVIFFYWLFQSEKPIHRISQDTFILGYYIILIIGTIVYMAHWIGIIADYPRSKKYTIPNFFGPSLKEFSVGGILVLFAICHAFGAFIALWTIVASINKVFKHSR